MDSFDDISCVSFSSEEADRLLDYLDRAREPSPEPVIVNGDFEDPHPCNCEPTRSIPPQPVTNPTSTEFVLTSLQRPGPSGKLLERPEWHKRLAKQLGVRLPRGPFRLGPGLLKLGAAKLLPPNHPALPSTPQGSAEGQGAGQLHHPPVRAPPSSQGFPERQGEGQLHHLTGNPLPYPFPRESGIGQGDGKPHHPNTRPPPSSEGLPKRQGEGQLHHLDGNLSHHSPPQRSGVGPGPDEAHSPVGRVQSAVRSGRAHSPVQRSSDTPVDQTQGSGGEAPAGGTHPKKPRKTRRGGRKYHLRKLQSAYYKAAVVPSTRDLFGWNSDEEPVLSTGLPNPVQPLRAESTTGCKRGKPLITNIQIYTGPRIRRWELIKVDLPLTPYPACIPQIKNDPRYPVYISKRQKALYPITE